MFVLRVGLASENCFCFFDQAFGFCHVKYNLLVSGKRPFATGILCNTGHSIKFEQIYVLVKLQSKLNRT